MLRPIENNDHSFPSLVLIRLCFQVNYGQYCESKFSKLIGKPTIFDEENEEYALNRCREIWMRRYPSEPFENEANSESPITLVRNDDLLSEALKQRTLCSKFSEPYMTEIMYLIAARQRYKGFLYILPRVSDKCSRFVPTCDILIVWLTHQVRLMGSIVCSFKFLLGH